MNLCHGVITNQTQYMMHQIFDHFLLTTSDNGGSAVSGLFFFFSLENMPNI